MDVRLDARAPAPVVIYPDVPVVVIHFCPPDSPDPGCRLCPNISHGLVVMQALYGLAQSGVEFSPAQVAGAIDRLLAEADTFRQSVESFYGSSAADPWSDTLVMPAPRVLEHAGAAGSGALSSWSTSDEPAPASGLVESWGLLPAVAAEPVEPGRTRPRPAWAWMVAAVASALAVVAVLTGAPASVVRIVVPPSSSLPPASETGGNIGDLVDGSGYGSDAQQNPSHRTAPAANTSHSPSPAASAPARTPARTPSTARNQSPPPASSPTVQPPSPAPSPPSDPQATPSSPAPSLPVDPLPSVPVPTDVLPSVPAPTVPAIDPGAGDGTAGDGTDGLPLGLHLVGATG